MNKLMNITLGLSNIILFVYKYINIFILDSSHVLSACNYAHFYFYFYFYFGFSKIMFKSEIEIMS